jgi:CRISPR-associated endoribonuclease Cas6
LACPVRKFDVYSVTFEFQAKDAFAFPRFLTGNIFRGALGSFLRSANPRAYSALFESAEDDVSLRTTPPRPFVLRCRNLDGRRYLPGEIFTLHLNLFLSDLQLVEPLSAALTAMCQRGFGPTRSRATLLVPARYVHQSLPLENPVEPASVVRIHFDTPTELKSDGQVIEPSQFSVLIDHIARRLEHLSALYGSGGLTLDRKALGKRAEAVALTSANLEQVEVSRRGSRLGQTHSIGGFVGSAEYSGDLTPFLPLLEAASFTGVGRHTVWGNGEISTERLA